MERIPRDEGEDDDDCDDRRLVINHSESSVSPTSGMTGSSHPSSGVPSPAPGVNGLRPEAVGRTAMVQPVVSDESSGGENSSGVHDVNRHISSPDSDRDEVDSGREDSA